MKFCLPFAALLALAACQPAATPANNGTTTATTTTTSPSPAPPAPAPAALTENVEFLQFVKEKVPNANSLKDLLDNKAPSVDGCGVPDDNLAHDCGYISKFETPDTLFVRVNNLPRSINVYLDKLYAFSPTGKLYYDEELDRAVAEE